jgi:hypothetical protein
VEETAKATKTKVDILRLEHTTHVCIRLPFCIAHITLGQCAEEIDRFSKWRQHSIMMAITTARRTLVGLILRRGIRSYGERSMTDVELSLDTGRD